MPHRAFTKNVFQATLLLTNKLNLPNTINYVASDCILELNNVNKNFDQDFEVIRDITFEAKNGEFVCFVGPSGCGKTVLLYAIAGFLPITSGKISMQGEPINSVGPDRMMVFQDHMLFPWKTVMGNVLFGLSNCDINQDQKIIVAENYLNLVDLAKFKDWPIHKLSGGMKQRVAFARALVTDPKILLMDEPFSSLDSIARRQLRKNLVEIWQKTKKTILFVTHSINEAIYLADTIHVMGARPTTINKTYSVDFARPRDIASPNFIKLAKKIEGDIEAASPPFDNDMVSQINLKNVLNINNK